LDYTTGCWFIYGKCEAICVYHQSQKWSGCPCGHYNGDGYLGDIGTGELRSKWADACNAVKWYGRDAS
jgi:hypothetical protein